MEAYYESLNNILKTEHNDCLREQLLVQYNLGYKDGYAAANLEVEHGAHIPIETEQDFKEIDEPATNTPTEIVNNSRCNRIVNRDINQSMEVDEQLTTDWSVNCDSRERRYSTSSDQDMSRDMIDFYAQSMKFKKERDAKKKANIYVNISSVDHRKKTEMTSEPPSLSEDKRLHMEALERYYGPMSSTIDTLETSLQLKYEECQDQRHGSKLWPHIPINISF